MAANIGDSFNETACSINLVYDKVRELFPGGERIIDLGCGSGELLLYVGEQYKERIGVDGSRQRLNKHTVRIGDWAFKEADLNKPLPFDDASIDAVFSNQVIEHVVNPTAYVAEIFRVLRPQGRCVITTPNIRYLKHIVALIFSGYGPRTGGGDTRDGAWDNGHIHYFTHRDMRELFSQTGFSEVHSEAFVADPHRGVLRRLLSVSSSTYLVRNFFSGNILVWAQK